MSQSRDHISVCICTYLRARRLHTLLSLLKDQRTDDRFDFSIVVVDNDRGGSARDTVEAFARETSLAVSYAVEPVQNIAAARNRSVSLATGNLVAFIDDDELPALSWLLTMYTAFRRFEADGVFGPVNPSFEAPPPEWMREARLFDRPSFESGAVMDWRVTGTGNVLLRRGALAEVEGPFCAQFGSGGEDTDFFRRSMMAGRRYVWCQEAEVLEAVPPERMRSAFQIRRALLRGKVALNGPSGSASGIVKSVAAVSIYALMTPISLLRGRHVFMVYVIRGCDHLGKLLALCRIDVITDKYITK